MTNNEKIILVMGATGQQGGAAARRLLERGFRVRALTRSPEGAAAKKLSSAGAEVVRGDFDDRASLEAALRGAYGAFAVQTPYTRGGSAEQEERQGKVVAEAAKAAGVEHFIYSSVGGAERSTGIPHFDSKWRIEERIRELGLRATILRPVYFMENFSFPALLRAMSLGALHAALGQQKPLQMIAAADIGVFAGIAFEDPATWAGKALEIGGDSLTVPQMKEAWQRVLGKRPLALPMPLFIVKRMPAEMSRMVLWFGESGYQADIEALRKVHPGLLTFEAWLQKEREAGRL